MDVHAIFCYQKLRNRWACVNVDSLDAATMDLHARTALYRLLKRNTDLDVSGPSSEALWSSLKRSKHKTPKRSAGLKRIGPRNSKASSEGWVAWSQRALQRTCRLDFVQWFHIVTPSLPYVWILLHTFQRFRLLKVLLELQSAAKAICWHRYCVQQHWPFT